MSVASYSARSQAVARAVSSGWIWWLFMVCLPSVAGRKPYSAAAAAHGGPVIDRCGPRRIPLPRPPAPRPGRWLRAGCAGSQAKITASGAERRALSGLAPPASTVLRIPLRGTRLRRAVDPGDLCQPSGPDGEGQARGQARNARRPKPPHIAHISQVEPHPS